MWPLPLIDTPDTLSKQTLQSTSWRRGRVGGTGRSSEWDMNQMLGTSSRGGNYPNYPIIIISFAILIVAHYKGTCCPFACSGPCFAPFPQTFIHSPCHGPLWGVGRSVSRPLHHKTTALITKECAATLSLCSNVPAR